MPLTREDIRRLLEQDPNIDGITQGGNAMGHYLEARLTDGRAMQIDFHDNPAWKDTDRLDRPDRGKRWASFSPGELPRWPITTAS